MAKIYHILYKFLAAIASIVPFANINNVNYPFSKEFKAINQDFISIGGDIKLIISNNNKNDEKRQ